MAEKVLMKGNEAIGEAAIVAGCRHYFGYPITPQSELIEYMAKRLPEGWEAHFFRPRVRWRPSTWSTVQPGPGHES